VRETGKTDLKSANKIASEALRELTSESARKRIKKRKKRLD